ncbi:MAG TPA: AAA family ATPase [Chitinophagaceae bacterium]|nr:AAA family ATPase [Chitinophagaceae bacterium]
MDTKENNQDKFNWTNIYPKIAKKLREYKDKRKELVKFIKDNSEFFPDGITGKNKSTNDGITDIDPFSFFALFNRNIKNRREVIKAIVNFLAPDEKIKDDEIDNLSFAGIPIMNNQSIMFFPKNPDDKHIEILWDVFERSYGDLNEEFKKSFNDALKLDQVDNMLASALFWMHPDKFAPFDRNSRTYYYNFILKQVGGFEDVYIDNKKTLKNLSEIRFDEYWKIVEKIKESFKTGETLASISHEAWDFDFISDLFENKNIIFYGAPGTGKTYKTLEAIKRLSDNDSDKFCFMQFHPSFTYEDFIDGIKPAGINEQDQLKLEIFNGKFKEFCIKVHKDNLKKLKENNKLENYYFIVDEINRGNLSTIIGETFFCLEDNYRVKYFDKDGNAYTDEQTLINGNLSSLIELQNSNLIANLKDDKKDKLAMVKTSNKILFGIPENIHFIGMMNDVDKSIDTFDLALRRRFLWIRKEFDENVIIEQINAKNKKNYLDRIEKLNNYINKELGLGSSYEFGHSYFLKIEFEDGKNINKDSLSKLFDNHLKPVLKEYIRTIKDESEIDKALEEAYKIFVVKDKKEKETNSNKPNTKKGNKLTTPEEEE